MYQKNNYFLESTFHSVLFSSQYTYIYLANTM